MTRTRISNRVLALTICAAAILGSAIAAAAAPPPSAALPAFCTKVAAANHLRLPTAARSGFCIYNGQIDFPLAPNPGQAMLETCGTGRSDFWPDCAQAGEPTAYRCIKYIAYRPCWSACDQIPYSLDPACRARCEALNAEYQQKLDKLANAFADAARFIYGAYGAEDCITLRAQIETLCDLYLGDDDVFPAPPGLFEILTLEFNTAEAANLASCEW